jgi:hypothetical protein
MDMTTPESLAATEPTKSQKYKHIVYKAYYEELDTGPKSRRYDAKPYPEGPLLDPTTSFLERFVLHPLLKPKNLQSCLPTRRRRRRRQPNLTSMDNRRTRTRRSSLPRLHRQRQTPRTNPRRTRTTRNIHHQRRPITITVLGNPMVALPAPHQPQIFDRRRTNQTHRRRTPRIRHHHKRILRNPRRLDQPCLRLRLPRITHRRRSKRSPTIPPRPRLRTQMANTTNGQHHPPHHQPKQIRRKTRHRSLTPTPLPCRSSPTPINARQLENTRTRRRTHQMDTRQKKRYRPRNGKLVRRTTLPQRQRNQTPTTTMATSMATTRLI